MQLVIACNNQQKKEWENLFLQSPAQLQFVEEIIGFKLFPAASVYIDLLFENTPTRMDVLRSLEAPVLVNAVSILLKEINAPFIRINAWPGFLGEIIEASCLPETPREPVEKLFQSLNLKISWLPDDPGFVTPRVIAMIINEAYYALEEGVSTRQEIDIAMKLGTAYPFGPFEWAQQIGLKSIYELLNKLREGQPQYQPAPWLAKEAGY